MARKGRERRQTASGGQMKPDCHTKRLSLTPTAHTIFLLFFPSRLYRSRTNISPSSKHTHTHRVCSLLLPAKWAEQQKSETVLHKRERDTEYHLISHSFTLIIIIINLHFVFLFSASHFATYLPSTINKPPSYQQQLCHWTRFAL